MTQAPPTIDSLEKRIKAYIKRRDHKPGKVYLGVPHRLDRPASGVMVFARHVRAARRLAEQFQGRLVRKVYWLVVEGVPEEKEGRWRDIMRKVPGEARSEIVDEHDPAGKEALLRYRVMDSQNGKSWLEVELETGRTHQIRIQSASRGFPILGDELYDAKTPFGPTTSDHRARWIALHARRIEFEHPMTRELVAIDAETPFCWHSLPFAALRRPVE